jgi:putative oxidoreductase
MEVVAMPAPVPVQRVLGLGLRVAAVLAFLPPLLTRLAVGQAFYLTGRGKIANPDNVAQFFTDLGIPFPAANAAFVSRLEYYGGMLLIVGLLTRIAAVLLGSTMMVALLTAHRQELLDALAGTGEAGLTDMVALVYLLFLLWLAVAGPGVVSLDAALKRWLLPRRTHVDAAPPAAQPAAA